MKICLVTAFPPSRGGLSEYGFHIARELQRNSFLDLTVLADELPYEQQELEGFSVSRCWSFDHPKSLSRLWSNIRKLDPDVVWFNLVFSTFGRKPLAAFCGLTLPLFTRLRGFYTHTTLHHLVENIDLKDAGVRFPRLYRSAGALATRILLTSNSVSVLVPAYRRCLIDKYGSRNVHVRSHGILAERPELPDFSRRGNPSQRILAFGKWGTNKRLEPILEAFKVVAGLLPNAQLVVAGSDHPSTPGYVASMAKACVSESRIEFTGYVPEEEIPDLFQSASIAVMAYSSATGSSGVAHLACTYGVPIISAGIADFHEMADEEGMAMEFYQVGNSLDLANRLVALLQSQERQLAMAEQNFSAALRMTMPQIVYRYLRQFDLDQKTKALKATARLRKLPRWFLASGLVHISTAWKFVAPKSWSSLFHSGPRSCESALVCGNGFRKRNLNGPSSNESRVGGAYLSPVPIELRNPGTGNRHDRTHESDIIRGGARVDPGEREGASSVRGEVGTEGNDQVAERSDLRRRNNDMDAA